MARAKRTAAKRTDDGTAALGKGERTREHILGTALRLFQKHGYDGTTMRGIAEAAGVSLGNAYYYFESKEHLIQGFYAQTHAEHLAACETLLASEKDLRKRLRGVLDAKIDTAEPYHRISGLLFKTAADPASPLNPFSAQSGPVRAEATALMQRVVEGSNAKLPADLRARLPELLWLYEMAVILFWIHDGSRGRTRTRRLIEHTSDLVGKLVSLASFPLLKPLRSSLLELLDDLAGDVSAPSK